MSTPPRLQWSMAHFTFTISYHTNSIRPGNTWSPFSSVPTNADCIIHHNCDANGVLCTLHSRTISICKVVCHGLSSNYNCNLVTKLRNEKKSCQQIVHSKLWTQAQKISDWQLWYRGIIITTVLPSSLLPFNSLNTDKSLDDRTLWQVKQTHQIMFTAQMHSNVTASIRVSAMMLSACLSCCPIQVTVSNMKPLSLWLLVSTNRIPHTSQSSDPNDLQLLPRSWQ